MAQIESGMDGGGWRQFLDGKAIHAGDMLEIELFGQWLPARYEMDYHARQGLIYICLFLPRDDEAIVLKIRDTMDFRWPSRE